MNITQKLASFVFPAPRSNRKSSEAHQTDLPANQANHSRCQFTFSDGRQCRHQSTSFCVQHAAKKQRHPDKDFPDLALERPALEVPELVRLCADLTTAGNINRALSHVFLLMAQGRITQKQAIAFGYLSQLLLQTVPGIRSEFVSAHGYRAWENKIKTSLAQNTKAISDPSGVDNTQPMIEVAEREKAESSPVNKVTSPVAQKEVPPASNPPAPPSPDYTSIFHRSLDLLDRKLDTTPEGRREAKALMAELDLIDRSRAKPCAGPSESHMPSSRPPQSRSSGSRRVFARSIRPDQGPRQSPAPSSSIPVATPSPSAPPKTAPAPIPGFTVWREGHSSDWYAPASWSGRRQPDPFPNRQEKQRRAMLRALNDRRWQHRMQNPNFWE
jgi:hypothetical protein